MIVTLDGYSWRVLDVLRGKALLLADRIIGYGLLDIGWEREGYEYRWADCSLKKELNSTEWLSEYLPELSRSNLICEHVPPGYAQSIEGGELGRVFLLSMRDACEDGYLRNSQSRKAQTLTGSGNWWWLRSPGGSADSAAYIGWDGSVIAGHVDGDGGIRPALWLSLPS
jgi:hypothetical protein